MSAQSGDELTIVVAVLTYCRPEALRGGLPLILDQLVRLGDDFGRTVSGRVVVVDNDPAASARPVVGAIRSAAPSPNLMEYVVEPIAGIAAARNRALDEGGDSRLLVFIDDDERPRENWLRSLVQTWQLHGTAAVMGRVISEFDGELDPWVAAGDFFRRRSMPTGTTITVAAAGNLLLDLQQVRELGVRFDSRLRLGAGEDSLFSRQLVARGGRIVWCEESAATDCVPPERMTRSWVLARAWSHGNTETVVDLYLAQGAGRRILLRASAIGRGLIRMAGGGGRFLFGAITGSRRHQARGLRTAYRGAGIAAGGAGVAFQEYARG